MLDQNNVLIAQDLQTLQKILNKISKSILELQEVNRDVLLGKKDPTCLSCNNKRDDHSVTKIRGNDG